MTLSKENVNELVKAGKIMVIYVIVMAVLGYLVSWVMKQDSEEEIDVNAEKEATEKETTPMKKPEPQTKPEPQIKR